MYPSCAQRVTVTYCGLALSTLEVLGRGGLLNQSRPLTQGLEQGQHLPWCEGGGQHSQSEVDASGVSCPPSLPLFLLSSQTIVTWEEEQLVCVQKGEVPNRGWRHWLEGETLYLVSRARAGRGASG